jgi:hypothetical protein
VLTLSCRYKESVREAPPRAHHAKFAGRVTPDNGMRPTADTPAVSFSTGCGGRVMPGVGRSMSRRNS